MVSRPGKLEVLEKILPMWKRQGHHVLIFTQWTKMLDIVDRFFRLRGWKFDRMDGKTNVSLRQRLVDAFNSDDSYFGMLMTTKTGECLLRGTKKCPIERSWIEGVKLLLLTVFKRSMESQSSPIRRTLEFNICQHEKASCSVLLSPIQVESNPENKQLIM